MKTIKDQNKLNTTNDNIVEGFCELFEGSNKAFCYPFTHKKIENQNKVFAQYKTIKKPPTLSNYLDHLSGKQRFTNIPIRDDKCKFGAIDVDQYDSDKISVIKARAVNGNLSLVPATSKSGGLYLFLFVNDWVHAKDMRRLLYHLASQLDIKSVDRNSGKEIQPEIFPKQDKVDKDETGSGINLLYYGSLNETWSEEIKFISQDDLRLEDWVARAKQSRLSFVKFNKLIDVLPHSKEPEAPVASGTSLLDHYKQIKTQSNDHGLPVMMELVRKRVDENLILAMMKAKRPNPNPPNAFEIMLEATKKKFNIGIKDTAPAFKPFSSTTRNF